MNNYKTRRKEFVECIKCLKILTSSGHKINPHIIKQVKYATRQMQLELIIMDNVESEDSIN